VVSFVVSMVSGYKTLMRSAELAMTEEEQEAEASKFDRWVDEKFGAAGTKVIMAVAAIVGIVLALGLFMFLPIALVSGIDWLLLNTAHTVMPGFLRPVLEGVLKIVLFVIYLALVRRMNDIRRVFRYHGAEHKTIFCYEVGDALTVENIRAHSRFHPRCGTSFIFIVLIIAIFLNSALPWPDAANLVGGMFMRVGLKLLMLPVVMAVSYEILRFAGRHDNIFTRVLSAPGMWIQRLTTDEPDDGMIEVAIAAVTPVLPDDPTEAKW
jgi:uncharacterized protein YqhQ